MNITVDSAVIMAAGLSSRFVPFCLEKPKGLLKVRGEVLIERQIRQLQHAGVKNIVVVAGYRKEDFYYLEDQFGVKILENDAYMCRNNHSSIFVAQDYIRNTYICSSDNYFAVNPYASAEPGSYYAAQYADGPTAEWCMQEDETGRISSVTIGGENQWFMIGHAFWDAAFSAEFLKILNAIYEEPGTRPLLWESIFAENLGRLPMSIRRYQDDDIFEFDTLEELRQFDPKYINESGSKILESLSKKHECRESDLSGFRPRMAEDKSNTVAGFVYQLHGTEYEYILEAME